MVDHNPTGLRLGVGIAPTVQTGHDTAFRSDDINRASGLASLKANLVGDGGTRFRIGFGVDPPDGRLGQAESLTRLYVDDGDRVFFTLDQIFDRGLIIAFGPQQGVGRLDRATGPAAGLKTTVGRTVDLADGAFQLTAQVAVQFTPNLGPGFGRSCGRPDHPERQPGEK